MPDLGTSGIDGLFTPILKFRSQNETQEQFCFQDCTACTQVCPTGAIGFTKKEEKQQIAIGLARVDKKTCIAWEKREYCVVCQEFCPYQAIIEAAASRGCDLIAMASHGRRGISALVLGSETTKVLTHSTTPVLVYR